MKMNNVFDMDQKDVAMILQYSIFARIMRIADNVWEIFEDELLHKFRFSSNSNIVIELRKKADDVEYTLKKDVILYRARIYNENPYDKIFPKTEDCDFEKYKHLLVDFLLLHNDPVQIDIYNKWVKEPFKGYNAKESGAPPVDKTGNGRANPEGIRYLYLCEDVETPVYEVRPIIGQLVNFATFKANRDLKIYDLTKKFAEKDSELDIDIPALFDSIGKHFSLPYKGTSLEYLPTQFLTEQIRQMGFDGLRFESSLRKGGMNVVIFNPDDFTAVSSDIVQVADIKLEIKYADIYSVGKQNTENKKTN